MKTNKTSLSRRAALGLLIIGLLTQPSYSSSLVEHASRKLESNTKTFDSVHPTEVTPPLDTLPQTLSNLFATPLAEAIRHSRDRIYTRGKPMPKEVRRRLAPFFPPTILDKVRYSTDWETAADGSIYLLILQSSSVQAVTLADVILFHDEQLVNDPLLWAHELTHVEQYSRLGIPSFATQYLQQAWVLENEAITKADAIKNQLSP